MRDIVKETIDNVRIGVQYTLAATLCIPLGFAQYMMDDRSDSIEFMRRALPQ